MRGGANQRGDHPGGYWDAVGYGVTETGVFESHLGAAAVAGGSVVRGRRRRRRSSGQGTRSLDMAYFAAVHCARGGVSGGGTQR